jgi:hypothetical protein
MSDKDKDKDAAAIAAVAAPEATAPEAAAPEAAAPEAEAKPKGKRKAAHQVRAVYGTMVDMSTGEAYTQAPCDCDEVTSWMQMQIDAGKMEVL